MLTLITFHAPWCTFKACERGQWHCFGWVRYWEKRRATANPLYRVYQCQSTRAMNLMMHWVYGSSISQVWLLTIYKFPCFRNRLVYSSMEGLDEAWAKFLSAQHGVGTDVEGTEPQRGNFHEFPMSIFRDPKKKESGAAFRSTDAELTFQAARILSARSSFEVLRRSQINSWCWATESLSHQFIVRIVRIVVT